MYTKPFKGNYPVTANRGWYSPFGQKIWHGGVDFGTPVGTPIYAFNDSTVVWSRWDAAGGGNMILLRDDQGVEVLYLHLNERQVNEGQKVKGGQQIGTAGATGGVTGAHLHFEFWKDKPPEDYGLIATDEMAIKNLPARWDNRWVEPDQFNNQNIMSPQELLNTLRREKVDLTNIRNGQDWNGRLQGLINAGKIDSFYSELFDILKWSQNKVEYIDDPRLKEKIEELEAQLAEVPESAVIEQLQAKQEEIDQLKQALDERVKELDRTEKDRMRVYNQLQELETTPGPEPAEKFDWNKFIVGLSKDQTFQRGLRHTVTFAIGVLASQFPEYAPYILGLAGVWGLGTEVQAFQVNQRQIVKEKK